MKIKSKINNSTSRIRKADERWDITGLGFLDYPIISLVFIHIIIEARFMMMNQAILMMPKAQVIDSRLQDQASRIQSKIQDSREEIKKHRVKTSYRISIKRFFQKPNSTVLFYKRIFSNFLKLPE